MKRSTRVNLSWTGTVLLAVIALSARGLAVGAQPESAKAEAPAKAVAPEKAPAKSSARLPNYYARVVSEEQREKILAIQRVFAAKIDPLRAQIEALVKERDEKIAAFLTPEQQKKIDAMKAAAKASRDSKRTPKGKSSTQKPPPAR